MTPRLIIFQRSKQAIDQGLRTALI